MLSAEVERLKAEIAQLKKQAAAKEVKDITWKVSEKGALSIYGLQRFPVSLYKEQWAKIFEKAPEIQAFIRDHDDELKSKD
jgi:hypothetical protein